MRACLTEPNNMKVCVKQSYLLHFVRGGFFGISKKNSNSAFPVFYTATVNDGPATLNNSAITGHTCA